MLANLLASLKLPEGSRVAVQTEKSVEALMLYLAVLRAGYVYLPLNNRLPGQRDRILHRQRPARGGGVLAEELRLGEPHRVFRPARKACSRWATTAAAACWSARRTTATSTNPPSSAATTWPPSSTPVAPPRRSKGAMLTHGNLLSNAQVLNSYWDLARQRRADPRPAHLPCAWPVRGQPWRVAGRREVGLVQPLSTPRPRWRALPEATVFIGRAHAVRAHAGRSGAHARNGASTCACSSAGRLRCCWKPSRPGSSAAATPSLNAMA